MATAVKSRPSKTTKKTRGSKKVIEYQHFDRINGPKVRAGVRRIQSNTGIIVPGQEYAGGPAEIELDINHSVPISLGDVAQGMKAPANQIGKVQEGIVNQSTTEKVLMNTTNQTITFAQEVAARWTETQAKHAKTCYHCPICKPDQRTAIDTVAKANAHIKQAHPKQLEMLKLQKADNSTYEPIPIVISPKRTLADFVPANQVERVQKLQDAQAEFRKKVASQTFRNVETLKASALMQGPESMNIDKVKDLGNKELQVLVRLAFANNKRKLLLQARNICKERNIVPLF